MTSSWPADHNWNIFASSLLIEVCARFGSDTFFVSPGYRDAPFIAALTLNPKVQVVSCWDERAAAFQALGWAKGKGKPAVLICTSGTAGANYLPAIIEARVDHIPLLVITADRPFELVFASAQQVIDQRDFFGRFVKKSLDFPAPSPSMNTKAWLSYARMLLEAATEDRAGPVHINLPFHAPLDPVAQKDSPSAEQIHSARQALDAMSFTRPVPRRADWPKELLADFAQDVKKAKRGLLLIGRLSDEEADKTAIRQLRSNLGWPVFADVGSGLKFETEGEIPDLTIPASRALLERYKPDCVIHVGKRLVTRYFDDAVASWADASYWVLSDEEQVQDPYHLPQRRQHRADWAQILAILPTLNRDTTWSNRFINLGRQLNKVKSPSFNFRDVAEIVRASTNDHVFLGNSTAIRAFDSWCFSPGAGFQVVANRGVSGIEGLLSTTIGLSLATEKVWTLIVGDIAMLHDLNAIISLAQSRAKVIVVLVNNVGGRIFETLPVQKYPWVKDPLISTPHAFNFAGISAMAGLDYLRCQSQSDFESVFHDRQRLGSSCIIECSQDAEADLNWVRALALQEYHDE
ncbi:MAG: 2-succinyl-5-enolpyruvyl-6-hydroxy-3-cyclohexene-1-carboxylic-acid synthase [Bdellovibrionota bacterium]